MSSPDLQLTRDPRTDEGLDVRPPWPDAETWAGVVLRPPGASWDGTRYTGPHLVSVDDTPLSELRMPVQWVQYGNFIGVVAPQRAVAQDAAARVRVRWAHPDADPLQAQTDAAAAGGASPALPGAMSGAASETERGRGINATPVEVAAGDLLHHYRWPAHAPTQRTAPAAMAVARWRDAGVDIWVNCEAPVALRAELARLFGLSADAVRIWSNGMPPSTAARDIAADAAMLSHAVGRPVCVEAATGADAAGARQYLDVQASVRLSGDDRIVSYRSAATELPWDRPPVASLLVDAGPDLRGAGAAASSYTFAQTHGGIGGDVALDVSSSGHARAAAHVFARESLLDEAAVARSIDPVELRLQHIDDPSGAGLVRDVAQRAGWRPRHARTPASGTGRGFAYACTIDDTVDPPLKSWSAWVADVSVDAQDGSVDITRLVVGHNLQDLAEPDHAAQRLQGEVQQAVQRVLTAPASFDTWGDMQDDPAATIPRAELVNSAAGRELAPNPTTLAAGAALTLPAAAAVSNAIYDATGIRLREPPFGGPGLQRALAQTRRRTRAKRACAWIGGVAAATAGLVLSAMPWRAPIAPVAQPDLSLYSAAAIERGRLVAAAGDCVVCHTAPGGAANAGGLGLETPFGTIYTTNITPDPETGIGNWSYQAFERAMREGIHRDGRHLYPAFPYTAFAKLTDADMQSLYAYLMSQPAVKAAPAKTKLAFPYNLRPLLAGWNALFHDASTYRPDPAQSAQWNRGAYLVQGAGHCGACHTPRNALGAEKPGMAAFLGGGQAEGWHAPALNALSRAPRPWTEEDLFQYLRTGFSPNHGVAAGPMAPVVQGLASLPESDVRAIAVYLASVGAHDASQPPRSVTATSSPSQPRGVLAAQVLPEAGERVFKGACAACHDTVSGPVLFGVKPRLELNTNLHGDQPDNLIQVILHGVQDPAHDGLGYMPGFASSLDDDQIAELVGYLRAQYGGGKPAWPNVKERVRSLRNARAPEHVAAR